MDTAKLVVRVLKWAADVVLRFLEGEDGPEVRRLIDAAPPELKADLEHARQRGMLEDELRSDIADDDG